MVRPRSVRALSHDRQRNDGATRPPPTRAQRHDPRRGRRARRRLPGDRLARRQRVAARSAPTSGATSSAPSTELGYVPNRAARSLVTRRSESIAVVITEPAARLFSDPFFPRLIRGISTALAARDLQLVLLMPDDARTKPPHRALPDRRPRRRRASSSASTATIPCPPELAARRRAVRRRRPAAARQRRRPRRRRQPGWRRSCATRHLVDGGRRHDRDDRRPGRHGRGPATGSAGYRDALAERGPRPPTRRSSPSATSPTTAAPRAMERLLAAPPRPRCRVLRLRPHGRRRPRRARRRPAGASPTTSPSSATTTRRSPPPPAHPSPASVSRSRRWAARWSTCSSERIGARRPRRRGA